jgi:hypothetical protein
MYVKMRDIEPNTDTRACGFDADSGFPLFRKRAAANLNFAFRRRHHPLRIVEWAGCEFSIFIRKRPIDDKHSTNTHWLMPRFGAGTQFSPRQ